jgi:hypothetical protein
MERKIVNEENDGFGGLVVGMLATGTRVRASEKSSVCLPSEEEYNNMSHVPALRHVKDPSGFL